MKPEMARDEAIWLAGFFDGEGCVSLVRRKRVRGRWSYRLRVSFTNTDLAVLRQIQQIVGGSLCPKASKNPRAAPGWQLYLYRKTDMAAALVAMRPFLRLRHQQADLGLAYLALPNVRRGWQGKTRDADWTERDDMKRHLTLLNKRGAA